MIDTADFTKGRLRAQLIALLSDARESELHTREIVRRTGRSPRAVHVALEQLSRQSILQSRRVGNVRLWSVNARNPLLRPLQELAKRTVGLPARFRSALRTVKGVALAFIFGSYSLGTEDTSSDVDVFLLGQPDWKGLARINSELRHEFNREINIVAWTTEELARRRSDPFYRSIRREPKIWLIGKEGDLEEQEGLVARAVRGGHSGRASGQGRRSQQARTRRKEPRTRRAQSRR